MPKNSRIEAIGQLLGTAKWVQESCREMPKYLRQPVGEKAELFSGYWQKRGNFCFIFSEALHSC
jgi:hypothetical protein